MPPADENVNLKAALHLDDGIPTPRSDMSESTTGLLIPEARDGFFGYTEEKSLQQVRFDQPIRKWKHWTQNLVVDRGEVLGS